MADWRGCEAPRLPATRGRFVRVDPLDAESDAGPLFAALGGPENDPLWQYIPFGPMGSPEELMTLLRAAGEAGGWQTHVFRGSESGQTLGMASYMRIRPEAGSGEVGCVVLSRALQRTPAATEAIFVMARHLFDDLGYRRFEWKCDDANAASKRAALRFGFSSEGIFRQDLVVKGRNRDTAWFAMIDRDWPRIRAAFEAWLDPANFDPAGSQLRTLAEIREASA